MSKVLIRTAELADKYWLITFKESCYMSVLLKIVYNEATKEPPVVTFSNAKEEFVQNTLQKWFRIGKTGTLLTKYARKVIKLSKMSYFE